MNRVVETVQRIGELTDIAMRERDEGHSPILPIEIDSFSRAGFMRSISNEVMPVAWDWEVCELIGGDCILVVKNIGP